MHDGVFNSLLERLRGQLDGFSGAQLATLRALLESASSLAACLELIEKFGRPCDRCPYCATIRIHRHGSTGGLQRYRCVTCRRTFNALTGTPFAFLRLRGKWLPFLQAVLDSVSTAVITVDEEFRIILFNRAAETAFRAKATEMMGRSIDDLLPERFRGNLRDIHYDLCELVEVASREREGLRDLLNERRPGVRVFGEMVNLLWLQGKYEEALELERGQAPPRRPG